MLLEEYMKARSIVVIVVFLLSSLTLISAQERVDYVDVKETNKRIASLEIANENHEKIIAENRERKAALEDRIDVSERRVAEIEESLDYTREANLELNALYGETRDRETKKKLEASRAEILSVMWILNNEKDFLTDRMKKDAKEIEFLTRDSARRESLIVKNEEEITELQQAVASTEARISEVSNQINSVIDRLDGLRDEVTVDSTP
jgi:chromosome segregation ATPase